MIVAPPQVCLSTLAPIPLHGLPRSNLQYLGPPLSQNIEHLPLLPPRCVGFTPYSKTLEFTCLNLQFYGATTFLLSPLHLTQCFMLIRSTSKLTFTSAENVSFARIWWLNLSPSLINLQTSSLKAFPHYVSLIFVTIS